MDAMRCANQRQTVSFAAVLALTTTLCRGWLRLGGGLKMRHGIGTVYINDECEFYHEPDGDYVCVSDISLSFE